MDEVKNYPPYLDYPKPYKAEVSTNCINRKAFIGEIEKHYCAPCKGQDGDLGGDWCRSCVINSVLEKVREFPAADVVEVRRGKWVHSEIEDDDWGRIFHEWTCSVCDYSVAHNPTGENYCPNCGAEMNKDNGYCYLGELKEGAGNE